MEKTRLPSMLVMYFLGFKEKEADYEIPDEKTGKVNKGHYHNFIISVAEPFPVGEKNCIGFIGLEANLYKIKAENICNVFGVSRFDPNEIAEWTFQPVEILYDKHGDVKSIRRVSDKNIIVERFNDGTPIKS